MPPNLPNVREDADRTTAQDPTKIKSVWDLAREQMEAELEEERRTHKMHLDWLHKNASYTDPNGRMYFADNQYAEANGETHYPSGEYSDGIALEGNPVDRVLTGRYIPADPPMPPTLGNRYTVPTPQEKIVNSLPDSPDYLLFKLAQKAGLF